MIVPVEQAIRFTPDMVCNKPVQIVWDTPEGRVSMDSIHDSDVATTIWVNPILDDVNDIAVVCKDLGLM